MLEGGSGVVSYTDIAFLMAEMFFKYLSIWLFNGISSLCQVVLTVTISSGLNAWLAVKIYHT